MLDEVTRAYQSGRDALDQRADAMAAARRARPRALPLAVDPDLAAPDWLADLIVREVDAEHGGFGADGKFLHIAALTAGVRHHARTPTPALADALTRTLDALAGGGIRDGIDGGFFRYAASREWMRPHTEKMLEDQVGDGAAVSRGGRGASIGPTGLTSPATPSPSCTRRWPTRPTAVSLPARPPTKGSISWPSAALRRYVHAAARGPHAVHRLDGAGGLGVDLRLASGFGDPSLSEFGGRALDRAVVASYRPGRRAGALRGRSAPASRGLLTDQVYAARALLDSARGHRQPDVVDDGRRADAHGDAHAVGCARRAASSIVRRPGPTPSACWPIR